MSIYNRRRFLKDTTTVAAGAAALTIPGVSLAQNNPTTATFTVQQVIDIILKEVPNFTRPGSVDQLRSGSTEQQVTGIVTTMFPSLEVIEKTAKAGANFIIAHETPFYNNLCGSRSFSPKLLR